MNEARHLDVSGNIYFHIFSPPRNTRAADVWKLRKRANRKLAPWPEVATMKKKSTFEGRDWKFFESENGNEKNVWKLTKFPIKDLTFFRIEAGPGKAQIRIKNCYKKQKFNLRSQAPDQSVSIGKKFDHK